MSSQNSCVVICVNVLASGHVDVMSTQNSCVVVCVNVLASGQVEVSRDANLDCFSWPSFILCILPFGHLSVSPSLVSFSDRRLVDEYGDRLDLLPAVDPVQVVDLEALQTLRLFRVANFHIKTGLQNIETINYYRDEI